MQFVAACLYLPANIDQLFEHTVYTDFTIYTPFMKEGNILSTGQILQRH